MPIGEICNREVVIAKCDDSTLARLVKHEQKKETMNRH